MFKQVLLTFILLLSPCVVQAENAPPTFDKAAEIMITSCDGSTQYNSGSKKWRAFNYLRLENGLVAAYLTLWSTQAEATTMSSITYTGKVNIFETPVETIDGIAINFSFLEEGTDYQLPVRLWVNSKHKAEKPLTILSLVEAKEKIHHWFFESTYSYAYTIELSDGSVWLLAKDIQWKNPWKKGTELIKVGTSAKPLFINKTLIVARSTHYVEQGEYLTDLVPLR